MAGALSFSTSATARDTYTLRLGVKVRRTCPRGLCEHGNIGSSPCMVWDALRPRDWSSGDREGSLAAQKTERGNRAHFGRATRTARAPAAEQLENYLPPSN